MRILQLVSCAGWSSDAYWAARVSAELGRRGHEVVLGCRRGTEERVIARARREGVEQTVTFGFPSGIKIAADVTDLGRLRTYLGQVDLVHVHRSKEHWLAAIANRLSPCPRPIVRTRHIAQAVRPHAANRWLYRRATALVVSVTEAIRGQYLAAGLLDPSRVVTLRGGVDTEAYQPRPAHPATLRALGAEPGQPLVGVVSGLRAMKGQAVVIEAATRLAAQGRCPRFVFVGRGSSEGLLRERIGQAGLDRCVAVTGFVDDVSNVMAALDVALYVPLESDGMSRVVFEYLAAGRALVASRVGAAAEVLEDGVHALMVTAGDAEALAEAIARLIGNPGLRARLGAAGRRLVEERYSGARLAAALEAHYARLCRA